MASITLPSDVFDQLEHPPEIFSAPSGRDVAYDLRGADDGRPCFWFHGSPSCRLEAVLLDDFGRTHGHRFIATDRPGVGRSSPAPGWSMLDHASDVVALADALGFGRFSVAGGSGGGPFVLAMASHAPDRIHRAISMACAGAFEIDALRQNIGWVDRTAAWAVDVPGLLPTVLGALSLGARIPASTLATAASPFARWLPGKDRRFAGLLARVFREATCQGASGVVEDTEVLHRPWGFELSEIRCHVDLVNGTADEFIPFAYGAELAQRIPRCRLHTAEDADHFRTIFDFNRLERMLT